MRRFRLSFCTENKNKVLVRKVSWGHKILLARISTCKSTFSPKIGAELFVISKHFLNIEGGTNNTNVSFEKNESALLQIETYSQERISSYDMALCGLKIVFLGKE